MAAVVAPQLLPFWSKTSSGNPFTSLGLNMSQTGPVNYRGIAQLLLREGIKPKDRDFIQEIDQASRQIDNLDLREQYNNRLVPVNFVAQMTSAAHNSMNAFLYKVVCPIELTNEMNFTSEFYEAYMAPYDEMNPLNIARETGYRRTFTQKTLTMFKRAQSAEYTLLSDPIFGPQTLARMTDTLDKQAELTMMHNIANALVEIPFYAYLKRIQSPTVGFSHTREIMQCDAETFSAADSGSSLINSMLNRISSAKPMDTLILPKGATAVMIDGEAHPMPVDGYVPVVDDKTRKAFLAAYENAATSVTTLTHGNGRRVNVFEIEDMMGYSDDPEESHYKPMTSVSVYGEHITLRHPVSLDDMNSPQATLAAKMLDILAPCQTPTKMTMELLRFRKYLKANLLFLRDDGTVLAEDTDGLGTYYQRLADKYNQQDLQNFKTAFRTSDHFDNNNPASLYLEQDTSFDFSIGFRHFDGFLCHNNVTDTIEPPELIGDIEPKTLPPRYLFHVAEVLARHVATGEIPTMEDDNNNNWASYMVKLRAILTNSVVLRLNPDELDIATLLDPNGLEGRNQAPIHRGVLGESPTKFSLPANSILLPESAETKAEYLGRVTPERIHSEVEQGKLPATETAWTHLLQHVPDAGLQHFLALVYATHKGGRQTDELDDSMLETLGSHLQERSLQPQVTEILRLASAYVENKQANKNTRVGAILKARGNKGWFASTDAEEQISAQGPQASTLATRVAAHIATAMEGANLGNVASGGSLVRGGRGNLREDMQKRYSWRNYNVMLSENSESPAHVRFTYIALLQSRFNFRTCDQLAKFGLTLFRPNYFRFYITQAADSFVLLKSGPQTWFLALGHGQVLTSTSGQEGSFAMVAQFHLGVIPQAGDKYMEFIPNALPREFLGGRNVEPILTRDHLHVGEVRSRRSLICVATPVNEDALEYPLSITREPTYAAPDTRTMIWNQKTSCTDIIHEFMGDEYWETMRGYNETSAQHFTENLQMATHIQQACCGSPISNNVQDRQWRLEDGTGPFGPKRRNIPAAHPAWNRKGNFPKKAEELWVM